MSLRNDNIRMMNGGEADSQPSKPIRLLSLFSGIGAFEKALDRENIPYELASFCEIDKFAVKSYCAVHGVSEDKNLGDISKVNTADVPDCDVLTFGFPCTDVSIAGKQMGIIAGQTRSGLLYEALRIIEAKKPAYAICENVKNLVGKKFKPDFDKLLFMLDELGYNSYWQVLNAKDYGIPQNRERVFVISIRKDIDNGIFKFPEKFPLELRLKDMLEGDVDEKFYLTPKQIKCLNVNEPKGTDILHVGNTKSGGQKSDIISADGIYSCLNATDYKQPKQIVDTPAFAQTDNVIIAPLNPSPDGTCRTIKAQYAKTSEANYKNTGSRGATGVMKIESAYESVTQVNENYAMLNGGKIGKMTDIYRRAYYEDGVSPTIHTCPGGNTEPKVIVSERMYRQAFETLSENDCKVGDVINPYNKKVVGDGTCPTLTTRPEGFKTANLVVTDQQIVDSIPDSNSYNKRKTQEMLDKKGYLPEFHVPYNSLEVKETSPTLTTFSGHFTGSGSVMYKHDFRIRKLTPKECWRLMGFDDSDFDKAKAAGISASQLYKQAGNSIVVNVLQYIFRNLFKGGVVNEA